jgi:dolichyl-diphosphooligosaccharide--protein glycosyltransferase
MVRLMLVLAPVMCILSGVAVSSLLSSYMKSIDPPKHVEKKSKKATDNDVELKSQVSPSFMNLYSRIFFQHLDVFLKYLSL